MVFLLFLYPFILSLSLPSLPVTRRQEEKKEKIRKYCRQGFNLQDRDREKEIERGR